MSCEPGISYSSLSRVHVARAQFAWVMRHLRDATKEQVALAPIS